MTRAPPRRISIPDADVVFLFKIKNPDILHRGGVAWARREPYDSGHGDRRNHSRGTGKGVAHARPLGPS